MEALKISNSYLSTSFDSGTDDQTLSFSADQITYVCERLISNGDQSVTIDFVDGTFIYLHNFGESVRYIFGEKGDYARLIKGVRSGKAGELFFCEARLKKPKELKKAKKPKDSVLIHNSLLPEISELEYAYSKAEVYFKPLDDIGGDFYWARNYSGKSITVVGDCTGHGVQGAMIAMSVMTLLKQHLSDPPSNLKESLREFYEKLKEIIEDEELKIFDVDLGFLMVDHETNDMEFVGSGINLLVKTSDGTKRYSSRKAKVLVNKHKVEKFQGKLGDQLFMYSDGISDQFDSQNKKKLGSKVTKLIDKIPAPVSISSLEENLNKFRGETEPIDDQTVVCLTV